VEFNTAWQTIRSSIKISVRGRLGYYELKKPWFEGGCSKFLDQTKRAKLQWLHYPSEIKGIIRTMLDVKPADISGLKKGNT
jgi:hypothetical protein